jgi:hypothetical protein
MNLGSRATVVASSVVLMGGVVIILASIVQNEPVRALGGTMLTMTSLTLIAMVEIRKWITNTDTERAALREESRRATERGASQEAKYIACQAALEIERGRMRRDRQEESDQMVAQLQVEREKLREQFEEERAALICETFEAAVSILQHGLPTATRGKRAVIPFPAASHANSRPHPDPEPERGFATLDWDLTHPQ